MNIVLQTKAYAPAVGGIETVARLLAEEFAALGHAPSVITQTPGDAGAGPVTVLRDAPLARQAAALRASDAVLMFGMSLRFLPLALLFGRRTVVSHHTWYDSGPAAALKRIASRSMLNIAASAALADALGVPATIIPNPYDDRVFYRRRVERGRDFVFVGRLVSDKGLALLIEALVKLAQGGARPTLTVIGAGPEEAACRAAAAQGGVDGQIDWAGAMSGETLALALNRHRVLVVPSLWDEPFGVVALEGAACGCTVVGSGGGGLPEAIGPCGQSFANGDANALAHALRSTLAGGGAEQVAIDAHLLRHSRRAIAERYLAVLAEAASQ